VGNSGRPTSASGAQRRSGHAYYTVADSAFFPGAVALLNSLRLAGECAPFFVVDCGLTAAQKNTLATRATVVPRQQGLHPVLQKATGPMAHPAEVMILVDADILITNPLAPLLERAADGQIIGFEDAASPDRHFAEWSSLGLGIPSARPYVNCGLLIFSASTASEFLPLFVELQERLDPADTHFGGGVISNPFYFADQDVLNGMLCTRFEGRVTRLEQRLAPIPPFSGLTVVSDGSGACSYADGVVPYALHHILAKPWLSKLRPNVYSELFTTYVTHPEAPIRLTWRDVPLRLTKSRLAPLDRMRVELQLVAHSRLRGKLGIRPAIERRIQRGWRRSNAMTDRQQ
jgi:hypothetical protein